MFILKKGHQPGVYVPLRALFLVVCCFCFPKLSSIMCRNKRANIYLGNFGLSTSGILNPL